MTEPNKNPNLGVSNLDIIYAIENISLSSNTAGSDGQTASTFTAIAQTGFNGSTIDRVRVANTFKYIEYLALANNGTTTIWTPTSGKKVRLMGLHFSASAAAKVHIKDGSGGTIIATLRLNAAGTYHLELGNGRLSASANNIVEIQNVTGSAIDVWVTVYGTEE